MLTQFDEHGMAAMWSEWLFAADASEQSPWGDALPPGVAGPTVGGAQTVFQNEQEDWDGGPVAKPPWYMDQALPVDMSVYAANEYGSQSVLRIYGAELGNELVA